MMTTDNDAKKRRLLGRYRWIQSAQLVGLTIGAHLFERIKRLRARIQSPLQRN
jgi:hypothetical protein